MEIPERALDLENNVTRLLRAILANFASGEAEPAGAVENMVRVDRRRGEIGPSFSGIPFDETVREYYQAFGIVTIEPVAVRGERLALVRLNASADNMTFQLLSIYESDEAGRIRSSVIFDHDNLASALEELDASCSRLQLSFANVREAMSRPRTTSRR